jgi:epoxyqueuosine reductase
LDQEVNTPRILTNFIKSKAGELGFSCVGIARAGPLAAESAHLREWLRLGYEGTMDWMRNKTKERADVRNVLPGAKSVVALAMNYYSPETVIDAPGRGKISRYAWGDDYHILLSSRIQTLVDCIKSEQTQAQARFYVDTGPVMDKAWAVRAGIGWLGKHTNVITRELGSWVFLGEIILDVDLEYDVPIPDMCGTCTACIDACPTKAIVGPYVLDSTKCISYLTIEHKGEIPDNLKPDLHRWVYGCDICQDVCPWNRFQQPTEEQAFAPRPDNLNPMLDELESLTDAEFSERFRRSPVKRTKRAGLRRNVKAVREGTNKG